MVATLIILDNFQIYTPGLTLAAKTEMPFPPPLLLGLEFSQMRRSPAQSPYRTRSPRQDTPPTPKILVLRKPMQRTPKPKYKPRVQFEMFIHIIVRRGAGSSLFPKGGRSRQKSTVPNHHPCKTCTHVSYQRISILTRNFNTSSVGHLAIVATLEYFTLTVIFSVFVESCSRVWFGCVERYTWLALFDENTRFFLGHGTFSSGPRGNSCVLCIVSVWSTAVENC